MVPVILTQSTSQGGETSLGRENPFAVLMRPWLKW